MQIDVIEHAWSLLSSGRIKEARTISEQFVNTCSDQLDEKEGLDAAVRHELLHAYHVAGYTASLCTRNYEARVAISYFSEMLDCAQMLGDDAQKVIALAYKGDIYRRHGDSTQAQSCLQAAYEISTSDPAARGNCVQLLARFYSSRNDEEHFTRLMQEAEEMVLQVDPINNSLYGQYSSGTVWLEYAWYSRKVGRIQEAEEYLARAEETMPKTPFWRPYILGARATLLVKNSDLENGMPLVLEAVNMAKDQGNLRLLDTFVVLERYLGEKTTKYNRAWWQLVDALGEPFEF